MPTQRSTPAYDTVWREGNFVRLHDMGVRGKLWRQLQSMSADPKSKIRLPFGETEYFKVTRGVAQGAVESPVCLLYQWPGRRAEEQGPGHYDRSEAHSAAYVRR